jgi:hypothetical protein
LLRLADYTTVIEIPFDDVAGWPTGELDRYLKAGLLSPSEPARSLICEECGELEDVILMESIVSPPFVPYLRCGLVGSYRIASERLQRWQMSIAQLMDAAFGGLALAGSREELVRKRMWRLGKVHWAGTQWSVFFGRALHCRDAWQNINQATMPARSVLFTPSRAFQADIRVERMPAMIGLDTVLSWNAGELHFDYGQVDGTGGQCLEVGRQANAETWFSHRTHRGPAAGAGRAPPFGSRLCRRDALTDGDARAVAAADNGAAG